MVSPVYLADVYLVDVYLAEGDFSGSANANSA
jgi:hypothetical protein